MHVPDDGPTSAPVTGRAALRADCTNCFGLCCAVLTLTVSGHFAIGKDAGPPCPDLADAFRCGIHTRLCPRVLRLHRIRLFRRRTEGLPGDPRRPGPAVRHAHRPADVQVFPVMRQLHELLWYLTDNLTRPPQWSASGSDTV